MSRTVTLSETLRRYWALLAKVPRAPRRLTALRLQELLAAEGFEVHVRSVQRDLEQLARQFRGLACDDRSRPYAWYWERDAPALHLPLMGLSAAVTFDLARAHLEAALPRALLRALEPTFEEAQRALAATQTARLSRWRHKVRALPRGYPRATPQIQGRVVDAVYDALLDERFVQLDYKKRGAAASTAYTVAPLGLVLRDGVITLVCSLETGDGLRHFLLHRVVRAQAIERAFKWPRAFSLERHIQSGALGFLLGEQIVLRLRIDAGVAVGLSESPLSTDQTLTEPDAGLCELTATVSDSMELRGYLRSLGGLAEVLAPPALRQAMAEEARAMAARYE